MPNVYLLHIDPPFAGRTHYIGMTRKRVTTRLRQHRWGKGGRSTRLAVKAGSKISLVCVWENVEFKFEYWMKQQFHKKYCPWCTGCSPRWLEQQLNTDYSKPKKWRPNWLHTR